ncbi:MAG: hypothetical protein NT167_25340 [Verrucomicrobia bacterium]|nr:hypothetical protein [Verrucomicrobiota bacterium]
MKTYRILGILWFAFCCYACFNELRALLTIRPTAGLWPAVWVHAGFCLLFLAGMVASIGLFRSARWARWFVSSLAVFLVVSDIAYIVTTRSLPIWTVWLGVFAVGSLVLLFWPRDKKQIPAATT